MTNSAYAVNRAADLRRSMSDMKTATAILGIAAPVSWVLVLLLGFLCSRGPDGGWSGMAAMFFALAIVLISHVAGLITQIGKEITNEAFSI